MKNTSINLYNLVLLMIWGGAGLLYLTLPSSPDQFDHNYMGWMVAEGLVPYKDFMDQNWPLVFWSHAIGPMLFDNQIWVWRLTDYILFLVSLLFLADILRSTVGDFCAKAGLILLPLLYIGMPQWFVGQHDVAPGHFMIIGLWFHVKGYQREDLRYQFGTGIMLGLAMLFKPTMGVLGPLLVLHPLLFKKPLRLIVLHAGTVAFISVVVIASAFFLIHLQGASWQSILDCAWIYNTQGRGHGDSLPELMAKIYEVHVNWWHGLSLASFIAVVYLFMGKNRSLGLTAVCLLWISGIISFFVQGTAISFHLGTCLQAVLVLPIIAMGLMYGKKEYFRLAIVSFIVLACTGLKLRGNYASLITALQEKSFKSHYIRFIGTDGTNVWDTLELVERIKKEVPVGESLLSMGSFSAVHFLSKRPQPGRFYYTPLIMNLSDSFPLYERWSKEWRDELIDKPPLWCILSPSTSNEWFKEKSQNGLFLEKLLQENYVERKSELGVFSLYARRD